MLVKTYPVPSARYGETVCCAGIDTATGEWRRIYPVNFRALGQADQFKKWQFIRATYSVPRSDNRPESIRVNVDTIEAGETIPPGSGWSRRRTYTDPLVRPSVEALIEANRRDGTSLGIIRPKVIEELLIDRADDWDAASSADYQQLELSWEQQALAKTDLERIPYRFRYRFRCDDTVCGRAHEMVILDWEIGQAYRSWRRQYGEVGWRAKLRQKYLDELPSRELHLVLGTHHVFGSWMVIGVFGIPRPKVSERDRRPASKRLREQAPMALPGFELVAEERNGLGRRQPDQVEDFVLGARQNAAVCPPESLGPSAGERADPLGNAEARSGLVPDADALQAVAERTPTVGRAAGHRNLAGVDDDRDAGGAQIALETIGRCPLVSDRVGQPWRHGPPRVAAPDASAYVGGTCSLGTALMAWIGAQAGGGARRSSPAAPVAAPRALRRHASGGDR
jgi:hypothetical protein